MPESPASSSNLVSDDRPSMSRRHDSPDESITAHPSSHVNVNRFTLPKDSRDLILAIVIAASLLTILIESYLLFDAYRAIKTQVWLRQDKEEEKFQKFVAGPYAELAGQLRANQILFETQCKEPKK